MHGGCIFHAIVNGVSTGGEHRFHANVNSVPRDREHLGAVRGAVFTIVELVFTVVAREGGAAGD